MPHTHHAAPEAPPEAPTEAPVAATAPPEDTAPAVDLHAAWHALGLGDALAQAAVAAGWQRPSAIQTAALPLVLQGHDVLGLAPTGSGKTAAFLLPVLQRLLVEPGLAARRPRPLRALVLAPTRELAQQTGEIAQRLAPELKTLVAVGGVSINPQMLALRGGCHVLVATPGRLLDLLEHNALRLSDLQVLVLDEADRLLDLGFADELARVLVLAPPLRQTLMFSATLPDDVDALAARGLHQAERLDLREAGHLPAAPIVQRAIVVDTARRTPLLRHLIATEGWDRTLVFVASQYASEHVAEKLSRAGLNAAALHGQLSQGRRTEVLAQFHQRRLQVLVATDLAARGLDIQGLAAVINHDLPRAAADHTHRIGRTGRLGQGSQPGVAVSFICADAPGSETHFRLIEKRQDQRVPREQVAGFEPQAPASLPAEGEPAGTGLDPNGGIKGRRKSKKDKLREAAAAAAAAPMPAPRKVSPRR